MPTTLSENISNPEFPAEPARKTKPIPGLKFSEIIWVRQCLQKAWHSCPAVSWQPPTYGRHQTVEKSQQELRELALKDGADIWTAVLHWLEKGRWPAMDGSAAFFLRERLHAATVLCYDWMLLNNPLTSHPAPTRPEEALDILKKLLVDYWDRQGIDSWLEENGKEYIERAMDFRPQSALGVKPHG